MERLTECVGYQNGTPIYKTKIDMRKQQAVDKLKDALGGYEDLEEQGRLLKLPCDTAWFILDRHTEHAAVMSKPIRDLAIYEIEGIDKKGYYWSTEEQAEAVLDADMEKRIDRRTMDSMIADICNKRYKA